MKQQLSLVLILTFIFIVTWLVFNIYHNAVSSTISENTNLQIKPISPSFDMAVIQKLQTREKITPILTLNPSGQTGAIQAANTAISTPTPGASQSAQTQPATTSAIPITEQ